TLTLHSFLQPNPHPNTSLLLPTLPPNQIYTILFQLTLNNIPPTNPPPNTPPTTYHFTVDPLNPPISSPPTSNTT
ncbi:hypothetical protein, partial [Bacillus thuringiensis]|uniref:hypothetical protein n=1 Tax=Bacillus thuringiensis TaxID=1428 RepID=UPI003BFA66A4